MGRVGADVMVPQAGEDTQWGLHLGQQLGARLDHLRSPRYVLERLAANGAVTKSPVTTIRSGCNPLTRSTAFAMGTAEKCGIVVQVAQLRDAESVPRLGQPGQGNFDRNHLGRLASKKVPSPTTPRAPAAATAAPACRNFRRDLENDNPLALLKTVNRVPLAPPSEA